MSESTITPVRTLLKNRRDALTDFFFKEETPFGLALSRMVICTTVFFIMLVRWPVAREIFSTDGATAPLGEGFGWAGYTPEMRPEVIVFLTTTVLFTLFTGAIGWKTRPSLIISNLIYTYLCLVDAISTMTKYSVISTHIMLFLALSRCGDVWSVDSWLKRKRRASFLGTTAADLPKDPVWPRRCIQILIGVVYFGASFTKMHTPSFFTGDQLSWWLLTDLNYQHTLGEFIALFPVAVVVMCYTCVIWEITFILMAWKGLGRIVYLTLGVIFHTATYFTLGLMAFPPICFAAYFAFMSEEDARWLAAQARWLKRRVSSMLHIRIPRLQLPTPSPAWVQRSGVAFPMIITVLGLAGIGGEYWLDVYKQRGPNGPLQLVAMDYNDARRMLSRTVDFREQDKFFAIDVGSTLVGDQLLLRRNRFQKGETLVLQCQLLPPHADMYVECIVTDDNERVVDRFGSVVTREQNRANFTYGICKTFDSGKYAITVRSGGQQIARKTVYIEGPEIAPANVAQTASAD